jgi:hypothetical protein
MKNNKKILTSIVVALLLFSIIYSTITPNTGVVAEPTTEQKGLSIILVFQSFYYAGNYYGDPVTVNLPLGTTNDATAVYWNYLG